MNQEYIICLDNGHASTTSGKCSPDKELKEYQYVRKVVNELSKRLMENGYKTFIVTPEIDKDISLKERCRRINKVYKENNKKAISISVHLNAAGNGNEWKSASGWMVYISPNASNNSKRLAKTLYKEAVKNQLKGNRYVPAEQYWVSNLAMCRDTNCPAILTENLFMDNKKDKEFLLSEKGFDTIVKIHYDGIINYLNNK